MNKFEENFFKKYTPEGQKIRGIIHGHWIIILRMLFVWLSLGAFIPSFLYYNSIKIRELVPFYYLEGFLILVFIKVIYEIFNRYNDVWIITNTGVIDLDWALLNTDMKTVKYDNIEGVGVEQIGILDTILNKGDIVIHKIGDDTFILEDAIIPYDAVDEIERISNEQGNDKEKDKFDIIMDALSGVVENYLKDKVNCEEEDTNLGYRNYEKIKKETIRKIKNSDNTIDLR